MIDTVDVAATTATTTATATATTATATAAATATRAITPAVNVAAASATVIFVRAEGPRGFGVGVCRSTGGVSPPDGVVCPVLVIRCSLLDVSGARLASGCAQVGRRGNKHLDCIRTDRWGAPQIEPNLPHNPWWCGPLPSMRVSPPATVRGFHERLEVAGCRRSLDSPCWRGWRSCNSPARSHVIPPGEHTRAGAGSGPRMTTGSVLVAAGRTGGPVRRSSDT
ncbi:MAG: hypothetical protein JWR58_554 [Pseudonocardia sp.]|jgi:hypothetical protein|nr:hypothetical protein [Pseudonocardia sp.]